MINILHVSIDFGLDIIMRFQLPQVLSFLDRHSIGFCIYVQFEWSDAPLPSYFGVIKGIGVGRYGSNAFTFDSKAGVKK